MPPSRRQRPQRHLNVNLKRVIDGDTVVIARRGFLSFLHPQLKIRLYGIDSPESEQRGGPEATQHLKKLMDAGRNIQMQSFGKDRYGRTIGLLYSSKQGLENSFNYQMIKAGHARWYRQYGGGQLGFGRAEEEARLASRGIWKDRKSIDPWDYRAGKREQLRASKRQRFIFWIIVAGLGLALLAIYAVINH